MNFAVEDFQGKAHNADSRIDSLLALDIDSVPLNFRKSSIICTIGPATKDVPKLVELIKSGMQIARMNFSHGSHEYHLSVLENVREATKLVAQELGVEELPIAIALDTKGPEIRTGLLESQKDVELVTGKTIKVTTNNEYEKKCSSDVLWLDYKNITKVVKKGSRVFIDDGLIALIVQEITEDSLECTIENGGMLGSRKGVNLPGTLVDLPAVSEKDIQDLTFGCQQNVDMIFASFIRNADGVKEIKSLLKKNNCEHIKIISKIENHEGVKKIDEIINESDGIMVARGDMGIEIPAEKVFLAQKMIITKCNIAGKPVICATQMLESMTSKPRPTRAEISDVGNAIMDGADCVMLSGETAKGLYPNEAVRIMSATTMEAEAAIHHKTLFADLCSKTPSMPSNPNNAIAIAAVGASHRSSISAIIVHMNNSKVAYLVAKYRPRCPIIAITNNSTVARQARLYRGLVPFINKDSTDDIDSIIKSGINYAKKASYIKSGDNVLIISGAKQMSNVSNIIRILQIE